MGQMWKRLISSAKPERPFLFAVSLSDHQSEAYDPRWPDLWDSWEQRLQLTPRGRATDFWHRYEEDISLARGLGAAGCLHRQVYRRAPRPFEPTSSRAGGCRGND